MTLTLGLKLLECVILSGAASTFKIDEFRFFKRPE